MLSIARLGKECNLYMFCNDMIKKGCNFLMLSIARLITDYKVG